MIMMSLTDECLSSIKAIDDCKHDAQTAVSMAITEAYAKHAELISMGAEYIMEGSFWTPQREDGENIFKTIFLFIPRLIYNLVSLLKNKWNELKLQAMSPELRELMRFHSLSAGEQLLEKVNNEDFIGVPNEDNEVTKMDFYIRTYIKDFDLIKDYYVKMTDAFRMYKECIIGIADASHPYGIDIAVIGLNKEQFNEVFRDHKIEVPFTEDISVKLKEIKAASVYSMDEIKKIMDDITTWGNSIDSADMPLTEDTKARARELVKSMRESFDILNDTTVKVQNEVDRLNRLLFDVMDAATEVKAEILPFNELHRNKTE